MTIWQLFQTEAAHRVPWSLLVLAIFIILHYRRKDREGR